VKEYTVHTINYPDETRYYSRVENPQNGYWKKSPEFTTKTDAEQWAERYIAGNKS